MLASVHPFLMFQDIAEETPMPLVDHGSTLLFAWAKDRFSVSWQRSLP